MKQILKNLIFAVAFITGFSSIAQTKIDSLIQKIDNKDVYLIFAQKMSPRISGSFGSEMVSIGKKATPELIKILDDHNKGIAAHVILSKIYNWEEPICCDVMSDGRIEIVFLNGLKIHIENNNLSATAEDLKANKAKWKQYTET
ncbi:hypothetical protein FNO01nite_18300 [Flavobacterium noncentrifugens]|uniref:Nuclear transport factor 2 family protein n=1 Tax=Flavobacterium noncentrifugens TaxID=1128970 RepID=A0A1G8YB36_9FLAO|nr:hypothetical protein [Flavobacterium noncentrifugens]GEP51158.1 hypothetical protein FNO01nite_18300 [Flavobacterium noncentrifugens]SDK00058.1 hypothetical protein SAMN04487935_2262 [Flavobacterium noncentrifugens]